MLVQWTLHEAVLYAPSAVAWGSASLRINGGRLLQDDPPRPISLRRAIAGVCWLGALGVIAGSALGYLGGLAWWLDLLAHFRLHYVLAAGGIAILALVMRRWYCLALAIMGIACNLWLLWPLYTSPVATDAAQAGPALKLLHFNVKTRNRDTAALMRYLEQSEADLIFVQEASRRWLDPLRDVKGYRLERAHPRDDNFGIAMLVADPLDPSLRLLDTRHVTDHSALARLPAIEARLALAGRRIDILSLHTLPPMTPDNARRRDAMLRAAGRWTRQRNRPAVVIGDLNATPWSYPMRRLRDTTTLRNAQRGFGYEPTWPSTLPAPLQIPIDHCLYTPTLRPIAHDTGPALGSDHHPIHVTLTHNTASTRAAAERRLSLIGRARSSPASPAHASAPSTSQRPPPR
jgi:endonuclease/exonuclease/phosphatase (EEP) superfamily protein YafD